MPAYEILLNALITLLVTIEPIGTAPLFLILTRGMKRRQRMKVALRAVMTTGAVLILFAATGMAILEFFGITIAAFRVAGGLLLLWMAYEMIYERWQKNYEKISEIAMSEKDIHDFAHFPLAVPLLAGPASVSATILLSQEFNTPPSRLMLIGLILVCVAACYVVFSLAERITRFVSHAGFTILTRLLGIILAALSVQYIADGVKLLGGS